MHLYNRVRGEHYRKQKLYQKSSDHKKYIYNTSLGQNKNKKHYVASPNGYIQEGSNRRSSFGSSHGFGYSSLFMPCEHRGNVIFMRF